MGVLGAIKSAFGLGSLGTGLAKTATGLTDALRGLVGLPNGRVDENTLQELEDALLLADVGVPVTTTLIDALRAHRFAEGATTDDVRTWLAERMTALLLPCEQPFVLPAAHPAVVLFVGVNGSGKTTTIGKLAAKWAAEGQRVLLAAGDTFRAGAGEQLEVWAKRAGVDIYLPEKLQADPAALLFQAREHAAHHGHTLLLADTAGRLQNKAGLMDELAKMVRVLGKADAAAPHATMLVLDATVGQNALSQVKLFMEAAPVSHLIITKLDGSAKAGVVLALAEQFKLPIAYVGVGEGQAALQPFSARQFAASLLAVDKA
ncbi:MAG: signal recognition particle-docking protein FtsY [Alphaproteobacteria bacterium]